MSLKTIPILRIPFEICFLRKLRTITCHSSSWITCLKTGKLFAFCCESVGIIKKQNLKKRKVLKKIGLEIGLLFQIADDLIDYSGNEKIAGKKTKKDARKGKATLISLLGYKNTIKYSNSLKLNIFNELSKYQKRSNDLKQTIEFILNRTN